MSCVSSKFPGDSVPLAPLSSIIELFLIFPTRILGPGRSSRSPTGVCVMLDDFRTASMGDLWGVLLPWERLTLATFIPALIIWHIVSVEELAGPTVHTILVAKVLITTALMRKDKVLTLPLVVCA